MGAFARLDGRMDGLTVGSTALTVGLTVEMHSGFERLDTPIVVLGDDVRENTASIEQIRGWIANDEAKRRPDRRLNSRPG